MSKDKELDLSGFDEEVSSELDLSGFDEEVQREEGSAVDAYLGGLGQDLSFGLLDEAKGALEAGGQAIGIKGLGKWELGEQEFQDSVGLDLEKLLEIYRSGRDEERQRIEQLKKESPTAFKAGEYTGMAIPMIASGGAGAVRALMKTGAKEAAEKGLKEGVEALGKEALEKATMENLKSVAKTGAKFGTAGAAGYSETDALQDPAQLAKEMATGAAIGATAGVILPEAIKVGAKGVKSLGRGIKEGSKSILKLASGLEKKSLNEMLEKADELQKVIHYPEIADRVTKETQRVQANIGKIAEASKEVLSEDKVIPKDTIVEMLQNRIKKLVDTPQEGAIPKIQKILDRIDPFTPQRAQKEAYDRLQAKLAKAKLQGDVVQGSQREAEKAMAKIQDKQAKMAIEAQQVGERVNFTPPKVEGDRIVVFETVTGKVISEKIRPLKRTPKFSKPKFDPRTNTIRTENLNTGKMIVEEIQTVPLSENVYPEKLISLRDLQEITQDAGKRVYEKDLESEAQKALRTLYHEMSDALKLNAPKEYRHFADEMAKRYKILDQVEKKLGIKVGYGGKVEYTGKGGQDDVIKALQKVGKETEGHQLSDTEKLLKELQEVQGKEPGQASIVDDIKTKKLQTELEKRPDDFNYPIRTMVGSGVGFLAGGGTGAVIGTLAGAAAKPIAREMIKKGAFKKLSMLPSIAQKITDKTAETIAPIVTARGIKAGAENAEEMAEYDYLESLLGDLEASEVPAAQELKEDLLNTLSEDSQKRGAAEFKIQSDPNARKYLKEHREKYEAKGKPSKKADTQKGMVYEKYEPTPEDIERDKTLTDEEILLEEAKKQGISGNKLIAFLSQVEAETNGKLLRTESSQHTLESVKENFKSGISGLSDNDIKKLLTKLIKRSDYKTKAEYDRKKIEVRKEFFNTVYGNREELGNTKQGDGELFRGRGAIQLTGRANYNKYVPEIMNDPRKLGRDRRLSARAAARFFADKSKNIPDDKMTADKATDFVNKNTKSRDKRRKLFNKVKKRLEKKKVTPDM